MRRALPAIGLTGAGLALVLSFKTTPLSSGGKAAATPQAPGAATTTVPPANGQAAPGGDQNGRPQGGFGDRGGFPGGDDENQGAPPSAPPAGNQPNSGGNGSSSGTATGPMKDGKFDGPAVDTRYGPVQVEVVVKGGKITDVTALQTPNDRFRSVAINQQATPLLKQEVLQAQSAQIDIISGATTTSEAYAMSLQAALDQARAGG